MEQDEEGKLKKRKTILEYFFTEEILSEVIKYFNNLNDYLNLAQINKYFYNLLLLKDNYLFNQFNELLFKKDLKLSNNLPNYIFKLKKLNISTNNDEEIFNLLNKFTNLKNLKCNEIHEQYFIKLTNLEELNCKLLTTNSFSLKNLINLKTLTITSFNMIRDEWIKDLTNLTELKIDNCNELSGECFKNLINLKKLNLQNVNELTDNCLMNLNNLIELSLNYSTFLIGNCFTNFKKLRILELKHCTNLVDDNLNILTNLEELFIWSCPTITFNCLQNLQQLQKLNIDIVDNNIEFHYKKINTLFNLKYLEITINTKKNKIDFSFFKDLTNLESLIIIFHTNNLPDFKDEDFHNLINLKVLQLNSCFVKMKQGLTFNFFKYLTKLEMFKSNLIFENTCYKNFIYLTNLTKLHIFDGNDKKIEITNKEIIYLKNLKELSIEKSKINVLNEYSQLQLLYKLQTVNIGGSKLLGNYSLFNFIPNLRKLSAIYTNISDKDLIHLIQLKYLNISHCNDITGECFLYLNNLKSLDISHCININFDNLIYLNQLKYLNADTTKIEEENLTFLTDLNYLYITNSKPVIFGKFLLQMNNLKELQMMGFNFNRKDIERIKKLLKEGATLNEVIGENKGIESNWSHNYRRYDQIEF